MNKEEILKKWITLLIEERFKKMNASEFRQMLIENLKKGKFKKYGISESQASEQIEFINSLSDKELESAYSEFNKIFDESNHETTLGKGT